MARGLTLGLALALSACATPPARDLASRGRPAPSVKIDVSNWPQNLWRLLIGQADSLGIQVTNSIFDSIDEFDLVSLPVAKKSGYPGGKFRIRSSRQVFDNFDLLNTWTVIDRFTIESEIPIVGVTAPIPMPIGALPGSLNVGFYLGGGAGMSWTNVRQVRATSYRDIPVLEDETRAVEQSAWFQELKQRASEQSVRGPEADRDPERDRWAGVDPAFRPRFTRFLNRVIFPGRLPLSVEKFQKLADGELISYTTFGQLEIGGHVGWSMVPTPALAEAGVRSEFKTYLRGEYVVSVLKENGRYAKVKVSQVSRTGEKYSIAQRNKTGVIYQGFLLFDDVRVGKTQVRIVPFAFEGDSVASDWVDVGYRYDLESVEGREAYERAVRGFFSRSEELDGVLGENGEPVVKRIFDRKAEEKARRQKVAFDLTLIGGVKNSGRTSLEAEVRLADGTRKILKEASYVETKDTALWGNTERSRYGFTVAMDLDAYANPASGGVTAPREESIFLIAEAEINDSRTSGAELKNYINQVEEIAGNRELVPNLPVVMEKDGKVKPARYGRTSFYFGLNLPRSRVDQFVAFPNEKKAETLSEVWSRVHPKGESEPDPNDTEAPQNSGAPGLSVGYQKMLKQWTEITPALEPSELGHRLGKFFSNRRRSRELMLLLRYVLNGQELDYFVTAQGASFGRVQVRGKAISNVDRFLDLTDQEMGFERVSGGFRGDSTAQVTEVSSKVLGPDQVEVTFHLATEARFIYFKLMRATQWKRFKVLQELIFSNLQGRFRAGKNTLVIDRAASDLLGRELARDFEKNNFYVFNVGYSKDGSRWGQPVSTRFQMPAFR